MCESSDHQPGCACDQFKSFRDGEDVPDSVPEEMLRPYPELWRQWQDERFLPWEEEGHGHPDSDLERRLHSPTYLHAVIREYEHLQKGGDRPDSALAARCEEIANARPEIAEDRRRKLSDPWWRAMTAEMLGHTPEGVTDFYDPDYLHGRVDYAKEFEEPFGRHAIESNQWIARLDAPTTKAAEAPNN